jgi:hypothetical protein
LWLRRGQVRLSGIGVAKKLIVVAEGGETSVIEWIMDVLVRSTGRKYVFFS